MSDGWDAQRREWARLAEEARAEREAAARPAAPAPAPVPAPAPAPAPVSVPAAPCAPAVARPRKLAIHPKDIPSAMEDRAKAWARGQ